MKHLKDDFARNIVECKQLLTQNMILRISDEKHPISLQNFYIRPSYKLLCALEPKIYSY